VCDGSFVSKTTYAALFTEIGHSWNGGTDPGNGTFRLPDLRDRAIIGAGSANALASMDAMASGSRTPAHTHTISTEAAHQHALTGITIPKFTDVNTNGSATRVTDVRGNVDAGGSHNHGGATGSGMSWSDLPHATVKVLIKT
jgi:microcystin-dependent protein